MPRSPRSNTARRSLRPPASRTGARRGPRAERGLGLLGLLLLVLFVAQSALWSAHGHGSGPEPRSVGLIAEAGSGDVVAAIGKVDGETHSLATEACSVCEMARRIGSEALKHEIATELSLAPSLLRASLPRSARIPRPIDHARAAPRAPPLSLI